MAPCTIVIVPSVTMNGSLSKYTTKKTLTRPTTTAAPIAARQASRTGHPCCTLSTARVIEDRPSEEPSDRSTKSPTTVGSSTAITRMNSTACEPRMLEGLPTEGRGGGGAPPTATAPRAPPAPPDAPPPVPRRLELARSSVLPGLPQGRGTDCFFRQFFS